MTAPVNIPQSTNINQQSKLQYPYEESVILNRERSIETSEQIVRHS